MKAPLVGMLTEGDLVRWHEGYTERQARWLDMLADGFELAPAFVEGIREQYRKVKNVMTLGVTAVTEEIPARDVAHLMFAMNIKRVPVLRDGKLVGIVARSDLYGHWLRSLKKSHRLSQYSLRRSTRHCAIGVRKGDR